MVERDNETDHSDPSRHRSVVVFLMATVISSERLIMNLHGSSTDSSGASYHTDI